MTHHCIEVTHQYGIHYYTCESFFDTALNAGLTYDIYTEESESLSDALNAMIRAGKPIIRVWDGGDYENAVEDTPDNRESLAVNYLASDLNSLIVINTVEDADYYANKYNGHEWIKVRRCAREILETFTERRTS